VHPAEAHRRAHDQAGLTALRHTDRDGSVVFLALMTPKISRSAELVALAAEEARRLDVTAPLGELKIDHENSALRGVPA
jgi:hypothetical protein